jgi:hypothetical protein
MLMQDEILFAPEGTALRCLDYTDLFVRKI